MAALTVGIIGMGDMGKMYARRISAAGWRMIRVGDYSHTVANKYTCESVNACDIPEKFDALRLEFAGVHNMQILRDGHLVARSSDYIIYSVEAEAISRVVETYAISTKMGAIVGGQTSCKEPEIMALEKFLPKDVEVISCHSLHGPKVDPKGQPLVLIKQRASAESFERIENLLACFGSQQVRLTAPEHDRITADTQAVTHAAFLSMGTAWQANDQFPWEMSRYVGGIENVKCNIMLRIYSNKWHVYAGLAILNSQARQQIRQYARSVTELFKLMMGGERDEFEQRVRSAGKAVFGVAGSSRELLLKDELLDQFSLGKVPKQRTPNSHLTLLAMVDCWSKLGIVPYDHMICSTPLFRLWLGVSEYLFRKPQLLDETIRTAIEDSSFRMDDLEFTIAARGWSECVDYGSFSNYQQRFERTQKYFKPRFPDAIRVGNEMIKVILDRT